MKIAPVESVDETLITTSASKLQVTFCAVFDCCLAILLKFIDNTGTVQFYARYWAG